MDIHEIYKLINNKDNPFSAIEKEINLFLSSPEKIARYLLNRTDIPQYVIEWLAMSVNSKSDLITIFVNHLNSLNLYGCKNDAYSRLILLRRINVYRGLPKYLSNLATIYSENWDNIVLAG